MCFTEPHFGWCRINETFSIIWISSGITRGRVLNGELYAPRLQKFYLSAFVHRLFHEDFSSIDGTICSTISQCYRPIH